jgi:hypothetical protein
VEAVHDVGKFGFSESDRIDLGLRYQHASQDRDAVLADAQAGMDQPTPARKRRR